MRVCIWDPVHILLSHVAHNRELGACNPASRHCTNIAKLATFMNNMVLNRVLLVAARLRLVAMSVLFLCHLRDLS